MTDAANLGWKLAARLRGRVPDEVLDTYEGERRPVGERALMQSRAQVAIERAPGEDGEALRALLGKLFAYEQPLRHLAALLHGSDTRYAPAGTPAPTATPPPQEHPRPPGPRIRSSGGSFRTCGCARRRAGGGWPS